ncbi:MAG TPA: YkvA family protein [Allosphingosinicella sp.]|nr:YkvA family protein [Allosphingosinicella sp.]
MVKKLRKRSPVSLARRLRVDAHAAWLAARDRRTPWHARAFGLLVAAYALSPIDLIPDFIPILGLLDDALLIPLGLWLFVKMLPEGLFEEHRAAAAAAAERPGSLWGAAIVVALWIVAALLVARLLGFWFD